MIWKSLMKANAKLKEKPVDVRATLEKAAIVTLETDAKELGPKEEVSSSFLASDELSGFRESTILLWVRSSSWVLFDQIMFSDKVSIFSTNMDRFKPTRSGARSKTRLSLRLLLGTAVKDAIVT